MTDEEVERLAQQTFAANVKRAREGLGWTQDRLAEKAGLVQQKISEIEGGTVNPTLRTMARIAAALGRRVRDLLGSG